MAHLWRMADQVLLEMVVEEENLDFLDLGQPAIIGDKERGTRLDGGRYLQSIGDMNLIRCPQDNGSASKSNVDG